MKPKTALGKKHSTQSVRTFGVQAAIPIMKKTNTARHLDDLKIDYKLVEYEIDESDLSAESVARKVGLPPEQVFKTLVARGDKTGVLMTCIPGNGELDLKAIAEVSGNKKVEMVHVKEIQQLTGYIRGGVSPIGTKKRYPIFLDRSATRFPYISISAGARGSQILVSPGDLIKVLNMTVCEIARGEPPHPPLSPRGAGKVASTRNRGEGEAGWRPG